MSLNADIFSISGSLDWTSESTYDYSLSNYFPEATVSDTPGTYNDTVPSFTIPLTTEDKTFYQLLIKWKVKASLFAYQHRTLEPNYDASNEAYMYDINAEFETLHVDWFEKLYFMRDNTTVYYAYEPTVIRTRTEQAYLGFAEIPPYTIPETSVQMVLDNTTPPAPTLSSNQIILKPSLTLTRTYNRSNVEYDCVNYLTDHEILCKVRIAKIS